MTVAVHIDLDGNYKAICAAISLEGLDKRLVKLNEKSIMDKADSFWSEDSAVKRKYKAAGIPEYKPAKVETSDG